MIKTTAKQPGQPIDFSTHLLVAVVWILLSISLLSVGRPPATTDLDPSWTAVLGWAAAQVKQFGGEIVFTYGPLGFLHPGAAYYPETYHSFLLAQLFLAPACAYPIALCLARATLPVRLTILVVYLLWLPWIKSDPAWLIFFAASMVVVATDYHRPIRGAVIRAALLGATAAVLSLIKFTNLAAALLAATLAVAMAITDKRRVATLGFAISLPIVFITLWLALGQKLSGLAAYVSSSIEIISGYSAMSKAPAAVPIDLLGTILLLVSGISTAVIMMRSRSLAEAVAVFFLGCILFLSWRGAFFRADSHVNQFLPLASVIPLYALAISSGIGRLASRSLALLFTIFSIPMGWHLIHGIAPIEKLKRAYAGLPTSVAPFLKPEALTSTRQMQWQQAASSHELPRFAKLVGNERVDLLMHEQGVVLVNGFAYAPRPVFQSYVAYTPELQQRNVAYFEGPYAPMWVILKIQTIDGRLPTLDDGPALVYILRSYELASKERGYLLFKRTGTAPLTPVFTEATTTVPIQLGKWNDLPETQEEHLLVARIDVKATLLGKLYGTALRETPLWLDVEQPNGRTASFRLPPKMAQGGFILSPVLRSNLDLMRTFAGDVRTAALRFRVRASETPFHAPMFAPNAVLSLAAVEFSSANRAELKPMMEDWKTIFGRAPVEIQGEPDFITEAGSAAVFLHAPSALTFSEQAGRYRLGISFGIRSSALNHPSCVSSSPDGIRMAVYSVATNDLLGAMAINPFTNQSERGSQRLEIPDFELPEGGIVVRMEPGPDPTSNIRCDWGYVDKMSLVPIVQDAR